MAEPRGEDPRPWLGRLGELAAEGALREAGMRVLARRVRSRSGEIDLIAERGELIVFVEVKARRSLSAGRPAEAVTAIKRRRMAAVASRYLARHGLGERACRFDVVEVTVSGDRVASVHHIEDAFRIWPTG